MQNVRDNQRKRESGYNISPIHTAYLRHTFFMVPGSDVIALKGYTATSIKV